jgi:hypothetical protein
MILPVKYKMKPPVAARLIHGSLLARDLVCYYPMNEGCGARLLDLSGKNNNGTFGAAAAAPLWTHGKFGPALTFDGGDYIALGSQVTFSGPFSISLWIYATAWDAVYRACIAYNGSGTYPKILQDVGAVNFYVRAVTSTDATVPLPSAGSWHHIVLTRDVANKCDLIINGGVANRLFADAAQAGNSTWGKIGHCTGTQYWNGGIDNVGMWNRALSITEIAQLYRYSFAMFGLKSRPQLMYVPSGAPPAFKPYWARRCNTLIGAA